jgi:hypothetical protein
MTSRAIQKQAKDVRIDPTAEDPQLSVRALLDAIEVLPVKADSRLSVSIHHTATGAHFRVMPVRDPRQPRIWCISVRRCSASGILETSGVAWIDRPGCSRSALAETIQSIRDDIGGWLAAPARRDLCRWLLTAAPMPTAAQAAGLAEPLIRQSSD